MGTSQHPVGRRRRRRRRATMWYFVSPRPSPGPRRPWFFTLLSFLARFGTRRPVVICQSNLTTLTRLDRLETLERSRQDAAKRFGSRPDLSKNIEAMDRVTGWLLPTAEYYTKYGQACRYSSLLIYIHLDGQLVVKQGSTLLCIICSVKENEGHPKSPRRDIQPSG